MYLERVCIARGAYGCLSLFNTWLVPSGPMKTSSQEKAFSSGPNHEPLGPVNDMISSS